MVESAVGQVTIQPCPPVGRIVMFCFAAASTVIVSAHTALLAVLVPGDYSPRPTPCCR